MNHDNYLVSTAELADRLDATDLRILDCRFALLDPAAGREAYERAHVPGAAYADLDRDLSGPVSPTSGRHPLPEPAAMCETFGRLGIGADTQVVAYDDLSGAVAARAWWLLRWLGHENAQLLEGGFAAWQRAGLPVEAGDRLFPAQRFGGAARPELVLETAEIAPDGVSRAAYRLVDVRSETRFSGDEEPIDAVAGHVPGAFNLPFESYLDAEGRWDNATGLGQQLESVLGADKDRPWCVMCGSGVTACHLAVAGLIAGYREPRVYVGSWSEWIRDPGRKVATGPG